MQDSFRKFAQNAARVAGSPVAFCAAVTLVLIWCVSGPFFQFSDTWQLVVNTGTTIVTFMMVFVIQNAQNRDAIALQLKLDELLCAMEGARLGMMDLDQLSEEELTNLRCQFEELARAKADSTEQTQGPMDAAAVPSPGPGP